MPSLEKAKCGEKNNGLIKGGGIVLRDENVKILKSNGFLVILEATQEIIHDRLT